MSENVNINIDETGSEIKPVKKVTKKKKPAPKKVSVKKHVIVVEEKEVIKDDVESKKDVIKKDIKPKKIIKKVKPVIVTRKHRESNMSRMRSILIGNFKIYVKDKLIGDSNSVIHFNDKNIIIDNVVYNYNQLKITKKH